MTKNGSSEPLIDSKCNKEVRERISCHSKRKRSRFQNCAVAWKLVRLIRTYKFPNYFYWKINVFFKKKTNKQTNTKSTKKRPQLGAGFSCALRRGRRSQRPPVLAPNQPRTQPRRLPNDFSVNATANNASAATTIARSGEQTVMHAQAWDNGAHLQADNVGVCRNESLCDTCSTHCPWHVRCVCVTVAGALHSERRVNMGTTDFVRARRTCCHLYHLSAYKRPREKRTRDINAMSDWLGGQPATAVWCDQRTRMFHVTQRNGLRTIDVIGVVVCP